MRRLDSYMIVTLLVCLTTPAARGDDQLHERLAAAKPGETITLPAGEVLGGFTVPAGVTLQGAGYDKTIVNAEGLPNGIVIAAGTESAVSELTVRGAEGANILAQGCQGATIRRARSTGGLIGVSVRDARDTRVENVICDENRYGIVVAGGQSNLIVNCTLTANANVGLSLASGDSPLAFNNCITASAIAVQVGEKIRAPKLDYNLYSGQFIGKLRAELPRATINNWRYLSGQDAHSVSLPVTFEDPARGHFAVTNVLDWALDRPAVAGWGTAKLGDVSAPVEDLDRKPRPAVPSLGAVEATAKPPRAADGKLHVLDGDGLTSAGVFDPRGKLVAYLFQALPLRPGDYSFWLPSRTYQGREIAAGDYEVRVLESKLDWEYLGWIGNTDTSDERGSSAPAIIEALAVDDAGRVIVGRGPGEDHTNVRCYDGASGKWLWSFKGTSEMRGVTAAEDGRIYVLRKSRSKDGVETARVTRLDAAKGTVVPWGKSDYGHFELSDGGKYTGIAALGDQLWYADTANNVVRIGTLESPEPTKSISLKSPESPAADTRTNVVWFISEGKKLVAVSPYGSVIAEVPEVPQPIALAIRDGLLAFASRATGKIHLFDASEPSSMPSSIKPLSVIGRGDGPDGLILADRFFFQDGAMPVKLAMGPKGTIAVGEEDGRLQVFDRNGKPTWSHISTGGWAIAPSKLTPGRIYAGHFSLWADSEQKSWRTESFHRNLRQGVMGDFQIDGQTFLAFDHGDQGVSFAKFTPEKLTPANGIFCRPRSPEAWTYRVDDNGDGKVNLDDAVVAALVDANKKPVARRKLFETRFSQIWPNGDLTCGSIDGWLTRWPCAGLDAQGRPEYRFLDRVPLPGLKDDFISPYDGKVCQPRCTDHEPRPGGGWMCLSNCSGNPAPPSYIGNGGSDVVGVNQQGGVDWVHPFGAYMRVGSLDMADGIYIAALSETYDFFVLNADGLAMPGFSFPERANYVGHWVDHPDTVATFLDKAGRVNVLNCDYVTLRQPWFVLRDKKIRESKVSLTVSPQEAQQLAALPAPGPQIAASKPPAPRLRVTRLKAPLPIDGDLQKWRELGLPTPTIITPETASGIEGGPRDCSAIIRLAYYDQDLYLQVIRFDDILTGHQPQSRALLQDAVEMCVNGFWDGVKHNLSLTTDAGPVNRVDARRVKVNLLDQRHSPLVIKNFDNAESVSERRLIEDVCGVSLRDCKVQVYETKIPMDQRTYAERKEAWFDFKPGREFWLGFLIDDNDESGTDVQNCLAWPATYGTYGPKEAGAHAVLD